MVRIVTRRRFDGQLVYNDLDCHSFILISGGFVALELASTSIVKCDRLIIDFRCLLGA